MARGNDSAAALADLRGQYAGAGGSVGDLIAANNAALTPALSTAMNLPRDTYVDPDTGVERVVAPDLDKVQGKVKEGVVLDAAKRGPYVVAVIESESGRTYKQAFAAEDVGFAKPRDKRGALAGQATEIDPAWGERMKVAVEADKIAREAEEAAEEARRKVYESHAKADSKDSGSEDSGSGSKGSGSGSKGGSGS